MATTKLILEYDGGPFAGWAKQPGKPTIQAELEKALTTLLRQPISVTVAGRTDRGVHAWGQVVSYFGEPANIRSINALLPNSIAVLESKIADPNFDARKDAKSRTYCYRVLARKVRSVFEAGRSLWWPHRVDFELLTQCANVLIGPHDFTAFTPTQTSHVRFNRDVFEARWEKIGDLYEFWIEADAFMRQMNRILVGTMLDVAGGRRSLESFASLLEGKPRKYASDPAPAHGLYLASVRY